MSFPVNRGSGALITVNRYLSFLIAVNRAQDPPLPPLLEIEFLLACFAKRVQRRLVTLYKSKKLEEYYNQEAAQVTWIYVLK